MHWTHHARYTAGMRWLALAVLLACEVDPVPDRLGPSRYEYCADLVNHQPGGFSEEAFRLCLEGPGARPERDAGAD
jgi:hypothetical protein